jgi:hypothetical protein
MKILETNVCIGLGDLICMKGQTDPFKNRFDEIRITYDPGVIREFKNGDMQYMRFLDDIGELFFSERPYVLYKNAPGRKIDWSKIKGQQGLCREYGLPLVKPNLKYLLCKGKLLNLSEEYIVITTKHRTFPRQHWMEISPRFWEIMRKLAKKYRIVILGEKQVEISREYRGHGSDNVYGIYQDIIKNLPPDRVLDLTVPALGITAPNLQNIQQDCLIMSEAAFVVITGIGGAFCMATAVANTIGYRVDDDGLANELYNDREYDDAFITRNFDAFIKKLENYL